MIVRPQACLTDCIAKVTELYSNSIICTYSLLPFCIVPWFMLSACIDLRLSGPIHPLQLGSIHNPIQNDDLINEPVKPPLGIA